MCGILGVVGEQVAERVHAQVFQSALDSIEHRGPDAQGVVREDDYCLGHRRLAIIDLTEGGAQPMTDPDTGISVVFNGEIFNYIEIRERLVKEGVRFHSESDTEVLLRAFIAWGPACISELNGMFAFGIVDPNKKHLYLARDRFSIKPLYYIHTGKTMAFASEAKALHGLSLIPREIDRSMVRDFLVARRYVTEGRSFFKGIGMLGPGTWTRFDWGSGQVHSEAFWAYPHYDPAQRKSAEETYREFAELMDSSVNLRLRSDVPVALSLSGGIDSTAILSAAAKLGSNVPRSFTSTFDLPGTGEVQWASIAAGVAGSDLTQCKVATDDWLSILRLCIHHLDGPAQTPSVVPVWGLMKQVRGAGIKVLLEGQGADELMGGYAQYSVAQFADALWHPLRWAEAANVAFRGFGQFGFKDFIYHYVKEHMPWLIRGIRRATGYSAVFRPEVVRETYDELYYTGHSRGSDRKGIDRRLWLDHSDLQLPRLLHYGDAITMAHSIESRMPFMDYRMIDWVFHQPIATRLNSAQTKWMIRRYLREHGQNQIADRLDKKGYPTPYRQWISMMDDSLLQRLFPADAAIFEFVDYDKLMAGFARQVGAKKFGANLLFRVLSTQMWLEAQA